MRRTLTGDERSGRRRLLAVLSAMGLTAGAIVAVVAAPAVASSTATFSNATPIVTQEPAAGDPACFQDAGATLVGTSNPYPSTVEVSGLGAVEDVNVSFTLQNIPRGGDVNVLLVGPTGASTFLLADYGYDYPAYDSEPSQSNPTPPQSATLTFDDEASGVIPRPDFPLLTGTYQPSVASYGFNNCIHPESFPAPAPSSPYGPTLSAFDGTDPNGSWKLFVTDDTASPIGSGSVSSWSIELTTSDVQTTYAVSDFASPVDSAMVNKAKAGQTVPFKFTVSDANGLPVTDLTAVTTTAVAYACESGVATDAVEEYATGGSGLQNFGDGSYQFNFKTKKSWAGSCRTLGLELGDGVNHTAQFQFK